MVVNTLVGKSLTLECETNAVPPPSITWYKNGRVVSGSASLRILEDGQRLEIKTTGVNLLCSQCFVQRNVSKAIVIDT